MDRSVLQDYRALPRRSAIRVCQPGPVALQRSMTSTGSRMEISLRGLAKRGRPPLFTTARDNIAAVSSGSSLYSGARIAWASTLARSDFKVRREAGFFTIVGLSHAENVAIRATRGIADHDDASSEQAVANNPAFTIFPAQVLEFDGRTFEHQGGIVEVQPSLRKRSFALGRIEDNSHGVIVATITNVVKRLLRADEVIQ